MPNLILLKFFQTVLDALDKTTQEVAESCSHLMPIQDKATVMASSSTEFQWLAGKTVNIQIPDSLVPII